MQGILKYIKGDRVIWMVTILLAILSVLAVYSSIVTLAYKYQSGNTEYFLFKHSLILFIGFLLMLAAHNVPYKYYSRISQIAIIIAIPLLAITLLTGADINEASRWLVIPVINQTFQTSDLAKLALLMYVARILSKKQDEIKDFKSAFVPVMIPILLVCGLILPANFSTSAILFTTSLLVMFIGRINLKYIASLIGIGLVALGIFVAIVYNSNNQGRVGTWKKRIESYVNGNSEANYQVEQSKIAIATGGIFGKKPGNSTQRNFLPHPYSDFIYAIIIEEYGLIGGVVVLFLYLILLFRGVRIASRCSNIFGSLLSIGLSFSLVFQALINMAVAVNLFPVTGQPLPLVSMGGTSIWFTCLTLGIILSVSRETETESSAEPIENKSETAYATH
ncbi:putative peptidoglycan glycosyltransferase FtsW [Flavobacteriales bacterium]|nr:putative peptidoglycan glycosyltransferase FtsW [Flavobacteriales bacterium]MCL4815812.1 putative lipid II flippase FtsW [Flavobacteriales bacterium]WKZ74689.1 MAG: putative peptidoglycan glycosyltransferase FtsW [Vicingaceae bacterium]GIK68794.1 MAG: cell division protein FtsW [Bacteroidota bacterium]CAG0999693.1 putative peptidoglycan glycosyltransferase FtsW [Flavobacteriales bacterium]